MKLKVEKCKLFKKKVSCLGRITEPDPTGSQAAAVLKTTHLKTVGKVCKLLGLLGYHRQYIPKFSRTAKCMFDLLQSPKNASTATKGGPN